MTTAGPGVGCPKCGQQIGDAPDHCRSGQCWWVRCRCGAVVDLRHPARHIPYDPPRRTA